MSSILKLQGWYDIKELMLRHLNAEDRREAIKVCKDFHETISNLNKKENLKICEYTEMNDKELGALLKKKTSLRRLQCATIGIDEFNELCKIRNLELLKADITEGCAGELANLKELELHGNDWSDGIFRRAVLPRLEKFVKGNNGNLNEEDLMALSRSSRNMQCIEINNTEIDFLPSIIEQFPKLKTSGKKKEERRSRDPQKSNSVPRRLSAPSQRTRSKSVHRMPFKT